MEEKTECLFEVSWEVCNKVGGIYTVIKSKADSELQLHGENYFLIGPYFLNKIIGTFDEKSPPDELMEIFEDLKKEGIICHYGKWLIKGEPKVILIDFINYTYWTNNIKKEIWDSYKIDSLNTSYFDFDETIVWSYCVGKFIEKYKNKFDKKIVAHFHEYLAGTGLLYLKKNNVKVGTVFTTHATILGRTLDMNNIDIYNDIKRINPIEEAYKYGIQAKFLLEKACAKNCGVFTSVSKITALECEHFLERYPDVILENGLNISKYPSYEEVAVKHILFRNKIKEFLSYYFLPYYTINLENTLIFFISGRYEFHNKGIDVTIEALAKLNEALKRENSEMNIVVFFWIPTDTIRIKQELIENRNYFKDVQDSIEEGLPEIKSRLIRDLITKESNGDNGLCSTDSLLDNTTLYELKTKILRFLKKGQPSLCTHDLNYDNDAILSSFVKFNLLNKHDDKVRVIFYPIYLSGADALLDLNYEEAIMGSHLGIFPSYYEPWGYTPLETAALGVPAITTDVGGFGLFVKDKLDREHPGIFVLNMMNKTRKEHAEELFKILYGYSMLHKNDRIKNKVEAKRVSSLLDWKKLITNYINAHNLAIEKVYR